MDYRSFYLHYECGVWFCNSANAAGGMLSLSVPYAIGRCIGINSIQKLVRKYPRFTRILEKQDHNLPEVDIPSVSLKNET